LLPAHNSSAAMPGELQLSRMGATTGWIKGTGAALAMRLLNCYCTHCECQSDVRGHVLTCF
jgi:hypothetical protein